GEPRIDAAHPHDLTGSMRLRFPTYAMRSLIQSRAPGSRCSVAARILARLTGPSQRHMTLIAALHTCLPLACQRYWGKRDQGLGTIRGPVTVPTPTASRKRSNVSGTNVADAWAISIETARHDDRKRESGYAPNAPSPSNSPAAHAASNSLPRLSLSGPGTARLMRIAAAANCRRFSPLRFRQRSAPTTSTSSFFV